MRGVLTLAHFKLVDSFIPSVKPLAIDLQVPRRVSPFHSAPNS